MRQVRDEAGSILVLVALSMTVLLGVIGMAVDVGLLLHDKRNLQTAADAAAIAGAAEVPNTDYATVAQGAATQNGVTNGSNRATVTINNPPQNGPYTGATNPSYVEAIVSQKEPTFFMGILGWTSVTVAARAVAVRGAPGSVCIDTLGSGGISASGSVDIQATNCPVLDNGGISASGTVTLDAASVGVFGTVSKSGTVNISPAPTTLSAKTTDPLSYLSPPSYNASSCVNQPAGKTLGPSSSGGTICYQSLSFSGSSSYTFNPGIYVVPGGMSYSGSPTFTGTGVTFYFPSGGISGSGSPTIDFTAPTSGSTNGMLYWEASGNSSGISISGSGSSTLTGIVYAPSASVSISGSSGTTLNTDFVVSSISMSGSAIINDYSKINTTSPLAVVKLVE